MARELMDDDGIETLLSNPLPGVAETVSRLDGDFMVLGAGGKMGTTCARMLARACESAGTGARVFAVSRFSRQETRTALEAHGIETIACDLGDPRAVASLPQSANILYLSGQKFGTADSPEEAWFQNVIVPSIVAPQFPGARIVAFSTGCVYPYVDVKSGGATEETPVAFLGDYAASCVGRERAFTYYAKRDGTRVILFRLNYSVELRYGVLVDIATRIMHGEPVDVSTGYVNVIWQGDAVARAIHCLEYVDTPPAVLNVTGPETLRVRDLGVALAARLGRDVRFSGKEADTAWLADASRSIELFGPPTMALDKMLDLVAEYVGSGGKILGKPTHFETRSGRF